jgi:uncharacterized LabA/DUF88 family protein
MSTVFSGQRTAILIDVQNLFYSAKVILQAKIDYNKLLNGLSRDRIVTRAIAYLIQRPDVSQSNFMDALGRMGFDIRVKEVKNKKDESGKIIPTKGNYSIMMALDIADLVHKVDTIIIVSGDGELVPLAEYIRNHGCRVEIAAFDDSVSNDLIDAADGFISVPDEWTFPDPKLQNQQPVNANDIVNDSENNKFDEQQPESFESAPVFKKK